MYSEKIIKRINDIIQTYESIVKVMDQKAKDSEDRAYGGVLRSVKGKLQEYITQEIIEVSWEYVGGKKEDIKINSEKIKIPIQLEYIHQLKDEKIKQYILNNIDNYFYSLSVDKQVFIRDEFVLGIECKAYTENAMLKRILVDFMLLKTKFPELKCYLFQLESQLGGDYSELKDVIYGSEPTHTLMSYFPNVNLKIFTFLKGERKVDEPIHQPKFYKPLETKVILQAIELLSEDLRKYVK